MKEKQLFPPPKNPKNPTTLNPTFKNKTKQKINHFSLLFLTALLKNNSQVNLVPCEQTSAVLMKVLERKKAVADMQFLYKGNLFSEDTF